LAVIGGILYSFLTYYIIILLDLSSQFAISAAVFIFFFYFGSRLLILFSGIDSPYYSRRERGIPKPPIEKNSFYFTTQWVGKFYHYYDIVLFVFLTVTAIVFLMSLIIDGLGSKPIGGTIQSLLKALIPLP
jgi:hypothetical protein